MGCSTAPGMRPNERCRPDGRLAMSGPIDELRQRIADLLGRAEDRLAELEDRLEELDEDRSSGS